MKFKTYFLNIVNEDNQVLIFAPIRAVLSWLSFVYLATIKAIIFLYKINFLKKYRAPIRIISVGNITWGGTGKTPLVQFIAEYLKNKEHKIAILIRGYGRVINCKFSRTNIYREDCSQGSVAISNKSLYSMPVTNYETMGDEAFMLSNNLNGVPVIVGADRIKSIKKAIKDYNVDTVVLDDGFQQRKIKKDMEVVVVDSNNPFGNGRLIPRGILREPTSSLKKADIIFLTKVNLGEDNLAEIKAALRKLNSRALILESVYEPKCLKDLYNNDIVPTDFLKAKELCILSGIASPGSFKHVLGSLRYNTKLCFDFPDHYVYRKIDLLKIFDACRSGGIKNLVTTEKDAVRIQPLIRMYDGDLKFFSLVMEFDILKDKDIFYDRLLSLYQC
ncbi:MAG: tetraacyldisaccharide 4'-kinase [Candidatus Omnitrophica bacterium]|nr:tetraacyldisaccharide 4'-kinase [Candidatus Omnitrophota bacterium]